MRSEYETLMATVTKLSSTIKMAEDQCRAFESQNKRLKINIAKKERELGLMAQKYEQERSNSSRLEVVCEELKKQIGIIRAQQPKTVELVKNQQMSFQSVMDRFSRLCEDATQSLEDLPELSPFEEFQTDLLKAKEENEALKTALVQMEAKFNFLKSNHAEEFKNCNESYIVLVDKLSGINLDYYSQSVQRLKQIEDKLFESELKLGQTLEEKEGLETQNQKLECTIVSLTANVRNLEAQITEMRSGKIDPDAAKDPSTMKRLGAQIPQSPAPNTTAIPHQLSEMVTPTLNLPDSNIGRKKPEQEAKKPDPKDPKKDDICASCNERFHKRNKIKQCSRCFCKLKSQLSHRLSGINRNDEPCLSQVQVTH